jgi:hypothetical protein
MSEISVRKATVAAIVLFMGLPLLAQPIRPAIVQAWPLPEPTLWQSAWMFVGQFLIFGLAVWVWNLRQRNRDLEREVERTKVRSSRGMADD